MSSSEEGEVTYREKHNTTRPVQPEPKTPWSGDVEAGGEKILYTLSHCLVAHREQKEVPLNPQRPARVAPSFAEAFARLPDDFQAILTNELVSEDETLVWMEKPKLLVYMRNQLLAIFCILVPVVVFGVIFMVDSNSPFALVGALLVWFLIVCMFILRWWCNVFETPRAVYALTNNRALALRFPYGKREVISVTYFEMRSKTGVSNIHYYQHWDKTGSCFFSELPDYGRVGFTRVQDFPGCKAILDKESQGVRPKTAPVILKKAFIAQLLKENEKPSDVIGMTTAEADMRRAVRAHNIVLEQERRRQMGMKGATPAMAELRGSRNTPLSGVANSVIRRESAMSAFTIGGNDTASESVGGNTPRQQIPPSGRGRGRGRGMMRPSPLGRGAPSGSRPPPLFVKDKGKSPDNSRSGSRERESERERDSSGEERERESEDIEEEATHSASDSRLLSNDKDNNVGAFSDPEE